MKQIVLLLFLFFLFSSLLFSQEEEMEVLGDTLISQVDLFEGDDPLEITLTFDMKSLPIFSYM